MFERSLHPRLLPQFHQYDIHSQTVQPGRKCRLASKGGNLSKKLKERFLRQVFCSLCRVVGPSGRQRVNKSRCGCATDTGAQKPPHRRIGAEADRLRFRHFSRLNSSRSGHATCRDARIGAMRPVASQVVRWPYGTRLELAPHGSCVPVRANKVGCRNGSSRLGYFRRNQGKRPAPSAGIGGPWVSDRIGADC